MSRRVLCLFLELNWWATARPLTYSVQLGREEGLRANGCRPLTVTTPWLPRLKEICGAERFDQVWVRCAPRGSRRARWEAATCRASRTGSSGSRCRTCAWPTASTACSLQLPNHPGLTRADVEHICDVALSERA